MNKRGRSVGDSHPTKCRLIIDRPAPGAWNMAIDESLLIDAAESSIASLRFYGWSEPTLSLGYFQRYADRAQHVASRECAVIRRQTGGGAILHDRELTYSLALPECHPLARPADRLYTTMHDAFIRALLPLNSPAAPSWKLQIRTEATEIRTGKEPFLCFQRQSPGDVVFVSGGERPNDADYSPASVSRQVWKILGSAQRRYRGAVLQHGSLLLQRSPAAPELPGLSDLTGLIVATDELAAEANRRLGHAFGMQLVEASLPPELKSKAAELANNKYGSPTWTKRR